METALCSSAHTHAVCERQGGLCPQSSETEPTKTLLEHLFPELPNIYISRDIKSV
jgi:hypothetical protein